VWNKLYVIDSSMKCGLHLWSLLWENSELIFIELMNVVGAHIMILCALYGIIWRCGLHRIHRV